MSRHALEALRRVAQEAGFDPNRLSEQVATDLCREFHRLRSENISLAEGLERANTRLQILEGTNIP